jgi:hypothetical protein
MLRDQNHSHKNGNPVNGCEGNVARIDQVNPSADRHQVTFNLDSRMHGNGNVLLTCCEIKIIPMKMGIQSN